MDFGWQVEILLHEDFLSVIYMIPPVSKIGYFHVHTDNFI